MLFRITRFAILLALLAICVVNRHDIAMSLPLSSYVVEMPLYVFLLAVIFFTLLIVGFSNITSSISEGLEKRKLKKQVDSLQKEVKALRTEKQIGQKLT